MKKPEAARLLNDGLEHLAVFGPDPDSPVYALPPKVEKDLLDLMFQRGALDPQTARGYCISIIGKRFSPLRHPDPPVKPATVQQLTEALKTRDIEIVTGR